MFKFMHPEIISRFFKINIIFMPENYKNIKFALIHVENFLPSLEKILKTFCLL